MDLAGQPDFRAFRVGQQIKRDKFLLQDYFQADSAQNWIR